jgi:DNA-binding MarR family transcriptional regulator
MMTSGGMTPVIDRLEREGLVKRLPNPADRRGSLVELSRAGRRRVDAAMARHAETEQRLVDPLDAREREQLIALLRKLLLGVDR